MKLQNTARNINDDMLNSLIITLLNNCLLDQMKTGPDVAGGLWAVEAARQGIVAVPQVVVVPRLGVVAEHQAAVAVDPDAEVGLVAACPAGPAEADFAAAQADHFVVVAHPEVFQELHVCSQSSKIYFFRQ
jgi:hypothetical protein